MNADIKTLATTLWREVRKDLPFFGCCGLAVGWLMVTQFRLKDKGIASEEPWAEALFSDFVSFNAFGLVFVGLLGLGALATCLISVRIRWLRLERAVAHLETRLAQLASSIICFTFGLSVFSIIHSVVTITGGGAALATVIVFFNCQVVVGFVSAALVARRNPPFDRWWVGVGMLFTALATITWFVLYGTK